MEIAQIISIVSVILGALLLLTSSIFIDDTNKIFGNILLKTSKIKTYFLTAGAFGVIASLIQMGSFGLAFLQKWRIWCIVHVAIFLMTMTAFSLAIDKDADKLPNIKGGRAYGTRADAFLAFAAIDFIFSFIATGAVFFFTKNQSNQ